MTVTIDGTGLIQGGSSKFPQFSCDKIANASKQWSKHAENVKKKHSIIIPQQLDVITSGDFVLIYPEWIYKGFSNSPLPGSGGITREWAGTDRSFKITVKSDEYPYSIVNNNYVVILSKKNNKSEIMTIADKDGIYLAQVNAVNNPKYTAAQSMKNYLYYTKIGTLYYIDYTGGNLTQDIDSKSDTTTSFTCLKISDIYKNPMMTIATVCNALAELDHTYSFKIYNTTKFTFYFSLTNHEQFLPLLFTSSAKYENVFTPKYFYQTTSEYKYPLYGANNNTWAQTIDFTKSATDSVSIQYIQYYDAKKYYANCVLKPSNNPVNVNLDNILDTSSSSGSSGSTIWIIFAIVAAIIIIIIIITTAVKKSHNHNIKGVSKYKNNKSISKYKPKYKNNNKNIQKYFRN